MKKEVNNPYETLIYSKELYEFYALEILKKQDSERYKNLEHFGGNISPDLQTPSLSIGVEVTCAYKKELIQLDSFFAKYAGALWQDIPKKVITKMLNAGWIFGSREGRTDMCYKINDIDDITNEEQIQIAINSISNKTKKLNISMSYCDCSQYELFIFLHKYLKTNSIKTIYESISTIYKEYDKNFSCIYILSGDFLYVCKEHFFFPYYIYDFKADCFSQAYKNSDMEAKSLSLLKQQGHI